MFGPSVWRKKGGENGDGKQQMAVRAAGKMRMSGMRISTDKFYFMFVVQ